MSDQEKRREILDLVIDMIAERGSFDFRMEMIAERAHVSTATLYRLWPSKDSLVEAAMAQEMSFAEANLNRLAEIALPALAALHAWICLRVLVNSEPRVKGMVRAFVGLPLDSPIRRDNDITTKNLDALARCYAAAVAVGHCIPIPPEDAADLIGGAVVLRAVYCHLISGAFAKPETIPPHVRARSLLEPFLTDAGKSFYAGMRWD